MGGVPQFVSSTDKIRNRKALLDLKVSLDFDPFVYDIKAFFSLLNASFEELKENAVYCQKEAFLERGIENAIQYIDLHDVKDEERLIKKLLKTKKRREHLDELWNIHCERCEAYKE